MAAKKTADIYGFNEAKLLRLIKNAAKNRTLAVAKVDGLYYATNGHWIFCVPETFIKFVGAIIDATGEQEFSGEYTVGSKKIKTKAVVDKFNEVHNGNCESAELTPWYYEIEDLFCRLVKTESGFYLYRWDYMQPFNLESGYDLKIFKDDAWYILGYSYLNVPRAVVMGVAKDIQRPPIIGDGLF